MKQTLKNYIANYKDITARVHSFESFGAADGPGVRFVLFLQGCKLRCLYCHNPDTWALRGGKSWNLKEILKKIVPYKKFYRKGGVTISGGEPFLQHEFLYEFLRALRYIGLHTAIDTSGCVKLEKAQKCINEADMILLDIKEIDEQDCFKLTGASNAHTLRMLQYCEKRNKTVWIRYVCVPNYTMSEEKIHALGALLAPFSCVQNVQLLPFHQLGAYKYQELNLEYKLADCAIPSKEDIGRVNRILAEHHVPIA